LAYRLLSPYIQLGYLATLFGSRARLRYSVGLLGLANQLSYSTLLGYSDWATPAILPR
jgi:hypothetical protein